MSVSLAKIAENENGERVDSPRRDVTHGSGPAGDVVKVFVTRHQTTLVSGTRRQVRLSAAKERLP
jgi:hypothetical protein